MENKIEEAEKMIAEGNTRSALEVISQMPLNGDQKNAVLLLQYRKNRTEKDRNAGVIMTSEYQLENTLIAKAMLDTISEIRQDRAEMFFETLSRNNFEISEGLVRDKNFIHAFTQTFDKVLSTQRREKIEFFANMLCNAFSENHPADIEEFEFHLKSLDALTFTEIQLLTLLFKFETQHSIEQTGSANRLKANVENWQEFRSIVKTEMNLDSEECDAYLISIEKTGLINFPRPSVSDHRRFGANTTVLFRRLYEKISHP